VFSVMRNVSVPIGISTPGKPNVADTLWIPVADQKNKVYYFQDTTSPSMHWVNLAQMDLSEGSGARRLELNGKRDVAGDQTKGFKPLPVFKFLAPAD